MLAVLRSLTQPKPDARMVDGKLVVTLPDADDPVVWRLSAAELDGAALRLRREEQGSLIGLEHRDGGFAPLARYRREAEATQALMSISKALMRPITEDGGKSGAGLRLPRLGKAGWAGTLLAVLVVGFWLIGRDLGPPEASNDANQAGLNAVDPAEPPIGVPLDADAFFGGGQ